MKPIIGIVGRVEKNWRNTKTVQCHEGVRKNVLHNGGVPITILPTQDIYYEDKAPHTLPRLTIEEKEDLKRIIDLCDGIIIPGTCVLYEFDEFIYEYALSKDIPILGICGGMQQMVICDNKKVEEKPLEKIESIINHFQFDVDYVHKVSIIPNTILSSIIKEDEITVNSRHNYKARGVNDLVVSGISEDGIIEAVEMPGKKFVLGVQWHPENMCEYDKFSNKIFESFLNKCKK